MREKSKINVIDNLPAAPLPLKRVVSSSLRPQHPSLLGDYSLQELKIFCDQSSIDYSQWIGQPDEKYQIVLALTASYKPDRVRVYYDQILPLVEACETLQVDLSNYKKEEEQAKSNGLSFQKIPPTLPQGIERKIDELFTLLLTKFDIEEPILGNLVKAFTSFEKSQHLRNSVCVLDDETNFMQEDEDMITIMDSDRFIDSIRLLTCKYRIMHSNSDWLSNFCTSGGISVLVENMDNRLDKDPMENTDAAALLQLVYCLKHIMQTDGLSVAIATRGAIDAFCMSLRFEYPTLALEVLGILAVVCTFGGSEGVTQTVSGLHHLARSRNEKPFAVLVKALQLENPQMPAAVLALVNAIMNVDIDLCNRISYRNDLRAVQFNENVDYVLSTYRNGSRDRETLRRQELIQSASIPCLKNRGQSIRFQAGMSIFQEDVGLALAEISETEIHPSEGLMAGICWEAKVAGMGMKKRWYELKDGVFSWYNWEEKELGIKCRPQGTQDMASVVEIMGYSTSDELQKIFKHCFVFQCSDGQRYQFGVQDRKTKERWMVALQTSMARASQQRTAYKIELRKVSDDEANHAKIEFKKQAEIYRGIEATDREIFLAACKGGQITRSQEISGFLQQELLSKQTEGNNFQQDYLKILTELLVVVSLPNVGKILENMASTIQMTETAEALNLKELVKGENHSPTKSSPYSEDLTALLASTSILRNPDKKKNRWKELLGITPESSVGNEKKLGILLASVKIRSKKTSGNPESAVTPVKSETDSIEDSSPMHPVFSNEKPNTLTFDPSAGLTGYLTEWIYLLYSFPSPDSLFVGELVESAKSSSTMPMRLAVLGSSRSIPIPPYLPGTAARAIAGAPLLPSQQVIQVNTALPPKPKIIPAKKMRQLQWLPLKPKDVVDTVWTEIEEPPLDEFLPELENGYQDIRDTLAKGEFPLASKVEKVKPAKVSLFEAKLTQKIDIAMQKLKKTPEEITLMITELNSDNLPLEIASALLELVPPKGSDEIINNYGGKEEDLDVCGRLMSRLVDIPRLEQRLKTYITTLTWDELAYKFEANLEILGEAVVELKDDSCLPCLKEVLSLILAIGNYMNGGTNKGQAHGIKLHALSKLAECRRNGSRVETLLHQVAKFYRTKRPGDILFFSQWRNVWDAKKLSLKQLDIDLKELENSLNEIRKEIAVCDDFHDALRTPLKRVLSKFLDVSEIKHKKIVETFHQVKRLVLHVRAYFGDCNPEIRKENKDQAEKNIKEDALSKINCLKCREAEKKRIEEQAEKKRNEEAEKEAVTTNSEDNMKLFFSTIANFAEKYDRAIKDLDKWEKQKRTANEAVTKAEAERKCRLIRRASIKDENMDIFLRYKKEQAQSSADVVQAFRKRLLSIRDVVAPDEEDKEF